jgi:hypothetical protein
VQPISCPIWGTPATLVDTGRPSDGVHCRSPRAGGEFRISGPAIPDVERLSDEEKARLTSWIVEQNGFGAVPEIGAANLDGVLARKRRNPHERAVGLLAFVEAGTPFLGQVVAWTADDGTGLAALAWSESVHASEVDALLAYLERLGFVQVRRTPQGPEVSLLPEGSLHLAGRRREAASGARVFVAMWHAEETEPAFWRGIAPAIRDAGYDPVRIDRKEHASRIDDEIVAEIRKSRFVVADFTCGLVRTRDAASAIPRGEPYFAAGLAQGLGIPVLWTYRRDLVAYVHFDTRQFAHLTWQSPDELRTRLSRRILAVFGEGPLKTIDQPDGEERRRRGKL